jgi:hypothetical protein
MNRKVKAYGKIPTSEFELTWCRSVSILTVVQAVSAAAVPVFGRKERSTDAGSQRRGLPATQAGT